MTTPHTAASQSAPPPSTSLATRGTQPINDANRLGLDYRVEAARLPYHGPILDVHTHLNSAAAARQFFEVADLFGIQKVWSMSPLEEVDAIAQAFPGRVEFIAVPNYQARDEPGTFTTDWLRRIEQFREKGCRIIKFWAAPRGRDFHRDALLLDSPIRREGMKLAYDLGYDHFMTHVADPDTWFATKYADAARYGTKRSHFVPLERVLDRYSDIPWLGAHVGGSPEDLDFLQGMLDRHPNYSVDTAATKWMTRELSKHPKRFAEFCRQNRGRVLFGSDSVASVEDPRIAEHGYFDLYASRYWALRTLIETDYAGPNSIVDPDLHMVDPEVDEKATADLRGANLPADLREDVYHKAAERLYGP